MNTEEKNTVELKEKFFAQYSEQEVVRLIDGNQISKRLLTPYRLRLRIER